MNRIVKTLMKRDHMSELDARELVASVRENIQNGIAEGLYTYEDVACIIEDDLGLEADYMDDLLI
ncbi:MAG: hypothetical protein II013_05640 [Lachnobacterium sp.]|nr:hypothetical protein [Lachnobacterium sp.]